MSPPPCRCPRPLSSSVVSNCDVPTPIVVAITTLAETAAQHDNAADFHDNFVDNYDRDAGGGGDNNQSEHGPLLQ